MEICILIPTGHTLPSRYIHVHPRSVRRTTEETYPHPFVLSEPSRYTHSEPSRAEVRVRGRERVAEYLYLNKNRRSVFGSLSVCRAGQALLVWRLSLLTVPSLCFVWILGRKKALCAWRISFVRAFAGAVRAAEIRESRESGRERLRKERVVADDQCAGAYWKACLAEMARGRETLHQPRLLGRPCRPLLPTSRRWPAEAPHRLVEVAGESGVQVVTLLAQLFPRCQQAATDGEAVVPAAAPARSEVAVQPL